MPFSVVEVTKLTVGAEVSTVKSAEVTSVASLPAASLTLAVKA